PVEHGGRGAGPLHHFIVQEELARARAPELAGRIGINLVGPTLLAHATEEQRARWLPNILRADELWCQLFSEPGAGSDLASVATRAARNDADDGWVVNAQKVWTSYAQFADWGLCLARPDPDAPKHRGISALVIDMRAHGPPARPWRDAHGNPGDGRRQRSWLYYQPSSTYAGTNEIQRNSIGERVLGSPR